MTDQLGHLVWFNVDQEVEVEHILFCQKLLLAGVATDMPSAPKFSDVFKRACSRAVSGTDWQFITSGNDNYKVCRDLVRNDPAIGALLVYASVTINKETEEVVVDTDSDDPEVRQITEAVKSYCESHSTMLTDYAVREHIRGVVEKEFQAVRVRQGVYFVLDQFDDQLAAVEQAVNDLADGVSIHTVKVEWTDKQIQMVTDAMITTIMADVAVLRTDLAAIEASDSTISKDRFKNLDDEFNRLSNQYSLFKIACGEIDLIQNALTETSVALMQTMGRIRV